MTKPYSDKTAEPTLAENEYHPAAEIALRYIQSIPLNRLARMREAIASSAIENNRIAEICLSTFNRLDKKEPVSDRYLMGLAWLLWKLQGQDTT